MAWAKQPPTEAGVYWWRRSWQWEAIPRTLPAGGRIFSHRYEQTVDAAKIGGEWGNKISELPGVLPANYGATATVLA